MPANPTPLTVSQEAREAAAAVYKHWLSDSDPRLDMMRDGRMDGHRYVQAFARFEADCAARFVENLEGLKRATSATQNTGRYYLDCAHNSAIDEAITAIQEPRP